MAAISRMFGGGMEKPKPVAMPDPEGQAARDEAERRRREVTSRNGRASNILSRGGGEGGTRSYSNSLLGQAG